MNRNPIIFIVAQQPSVLEALGSDLSRRSVSEFLAAWTAGREAGL